MEKSVSVRSAWLFPRKMLLSPLSNQNNYRCSIVSIGLLCIGLFCSRIVKKSFRTERGLHFAPPG